MGGMTSRAGWSSRVRWCPRSTGPGPRVPSRPAGARPGVLEPSFDKHHRVLDELRRHELIGRRKNMHSMEPASSSTVAIGQALPCLVILRCRRGMIPPMVTTTISDCSPPVSWEIQRRLLGPHVLQTERRVIGDVPTEHLPLLGERIGLVPLVGGEHQSRPKPGSLLSSLPVPPEQVELALGLLGLDLRPRCRSSAGSAPSTPLRVCPIVSNAPALMTTPWCACCRRRPRPCRGSPGGASSPSPWGCG